MDNAKPDQRTGRQPAARFLWSAFALWGVVTLWLLSDREPTQKEMTFAYRKQAVVAAAIVDLRERNRYRQHLHSFSLEKHDCTKLAERRYACNARLLPASDDEPLPLRGVFTHGASGWAYTPSS